MGAVCDYFVEGREGPSWVTGCDKDAANFLDALGEVFDACDGVWVTETNELCLKFRAEFWDACCFQ